MDIKPDITYRTGTTPPHSTYQLASGYISRTVIFFEKEGICAHVESEGTVTFFDASGKLLGCKSVQKEEGGRECYEEIEISVENDIIKLCFPICKWIDNYPHCDGEHDRWDRVKIGERVVRYEIGCRRIEGD